jgi:hypothetical protein
MDYLDYAELRRRAEKRLTVLPVWPVVAYQLFAYAAVFLFNGSNYLLSVPAGVGAFFLLVLAFVVHPSRTAANRNVRRRAIDDTLAYAEATGWPLENPTARELRVAAALLDDDLETRAGVGRALQWSLAAAWGLWILTFLVGYFYSPGAEFIALAGNFILWFGLLGILLFAHQQARRAADGRVRSALDRLALNSPPRRKRDGAAPWWDDQAEQEKPKRVLLEEETLRVDDDGELADIGDDELFKRGGMSSGA